MSAPRSDSFDTDVVIIGGGPIGLTTACALAHQGVAYRIFETRTEPRPCSRANNLRARPQELLASIGIRDALAEKAYAITKVNTLLNGRTDGRSIRSPSPTSPAPSVRCFTADRT